MEGVRHLYAPAFLLPWSTLPLLFTGFAMGGKMGKRGPKPTPTPMLRLRGSWRADTRDGEPKPAAETPDYPGWVSEAARPHWNEIVQVLGAMGVMSRAHTLALSLLVEAVADWIRLKTKADATPDCTVGQNGAEFPHPIHGMKAKAWERVLKACREFGMTPSAISAVRVVKKEEKKSGLGDYKLA